MNAMGSVILSAGSFYSELNEIGKMFCIFVYWQIYFARKNRSILINN